MSDPIRELEIANAQLTELRTQLATMAELYESQRKILHAVGGERDAATQRADAAESALRLATDSAPGKTTGVWMTLAAYQDLLSKLTEIEARVKAQMAQLAAVTAQRNALQVDAGALVRLRDDTDNVLWSLKPEDVPGAINWGDLGARETQEVIDESRRWHRVIIEEADPSNPALHAAVLAGLVALGWQADDVEIETAW